MHISLPIAVLLALAPVPQDAAKTAGEAPRVLDGTEKTIVIVGYSTSFAWPAMLQDMLDDHFGKRVVHVMNATVGGSPVERWIAEPGTRYHDRVFGAMVRDFFGPNPRLLGDAPRPTIAVCQQSLQFTRTQRGPIADENDEEGIQIGADALETMARKLRELEIEQVWIAMHIYKKPIEPEVGNERLALRELLRRDHGYIFEGPDLWTITRDTWPDSFEDDGVHPNLLGTKLMAEHWYRALAGDDVKQDVIDRMHAREYDLRGMMRAYLDWRRSAEKQAGASRGEEKANGG